MRFASWLSLFISAFVSISTSSFAAEPNAQWGHKYPALINTISSSSGASKTLNESVFLKLGSKKSAKVLVSELFNSYASTQEGTYELKAGHPIETKVLVFIPAKYLPEVGKYGLRNYHQIGHTNGLAQKEFRIGAENWLMDVKLKSDCDLELDCPLHALRPKYGILQPNSHAEGDVRIDNLAKYGEAILVLKDKVKLRTTFTTGDSLDGYRAATNPEMALFVRPLKKAQPATSFNDLTEHTESFIEAQIWGSVDPSDIEEVRIPPNDQDSLSFAIQMGLPVYSYERSFFNQVNDDSSGYASIDELGKAVAPQQKLYEGDPKIVNGLRKAASRECRAQHRCR